MMMTPWGGCFACSFCRSHHHLLRGRCYGKSTASFVVAVATVVVVRAIRVAGTRMLSALPLMNFMLSTVVVFPAMVVAVIVVSALVEVATMLVIAAVVIAVLMVVGTAYVRGWECVV